MAKLEIAVEVADDNILGKVAKVEETRRAFNNAWADLVNCFTAKYGTAYGNPGRQEIRRVVCQSHLQDCYTTISELLKFRNLT